MKVIIYSRVSTKEQSTTRQVNELKAVQGYEVVKVFREKISGMSKLSSERPQLCKAIAFAEDNAIPMMMVHEISRLGRNTLDVLQLIESLKKKGI